MKRVQAVDVIRGLVMMLMALDHVRVYSGIPASSPEPAIFLTRWVTNFCAPGFFLLAGVSAFLSMRGRGRSGVARMLVVRGVWLILLELTIVRFGWTFNCEIDSYLFAGVIWSLGWSMVLMAVLVCLPRIVVALFASIVIVGHNAVGAVFVTGSPWQEAYPWFWRIIYTGGVISPGQGAPDLIVLYSVVPWVAVMSLGFALASLLVPSSARRRRLCVSVGAAMVAVFLWLRATGWYGDPRPWVSFGPEWPGWIAFLNTTKYPASFSYLMMTLGPIFLAAPWLEKARGWLVRVAVTFGRVPLFFYVLHIPLIHLLMLLLAWLRSPNAIAWMFDDHPIPMGAPPDGYTFGLPLLYGFTVVVLTLLYWACRWYAGVRARMPRAFRGLL